MDAVQWDPKLASHFDAYADEQTFSGTILVAQEGEVRFLKAYGKANYEHDVPNRHDTKFQIASITKPITAMAVLTLADQRLIDVKLPIGHYFAEGPLWNETIRRSTIHQLLTHTSGIPDFEKLPHYVNGTERTLFEGENILQLIHDVPASFEPGEGWSYCNTGYNLLGLLIERVTGMNYDQYVRANILEPLGMNDTGFGSSDRIVQGLASGYSRGEEGTIVKARFHEIRNFKASGHMYSTVADLWKWDQALYPGRLVTEEILERMFTPHAYVEPDRYYGYGWSLYDDGSRGHGGWLPGYWCKFRQYPASGSIVIMLSNHDFTEEERILDRTGKLLRP